MGSSLASLEQDIAGQAIARLTFTYTDDEKLEYARTLAAGVRSGNRFLMSFMIILAAIGGLVVLSFIHWAAGGSDGYGLIAMLLGLGVFVTPVAIWNRRKASLRRNFFRDFLNGEYRYFLLPGRIVAFADWRASLFDLAENRLIQTENLLVVNGPQNGDTLIIPRRLDANGVWQRAIDAARQPAPTPNAAPLTPPPAA